MHRYQLSLTIPTPLDIMLLGDKLPITPQNVQNVLFMGISHCSCSKQRHKAGIMSDLIQICQNIYLSEVLHITRPYPHLQPLELR